MKKTLKATISVAVAAIVSLSCLAVTACGGGDDFGYDAPAQSNSGSSRGAKPQLQPFDDDGDIPF